MFPPFKYFYEEETEEDETEEVIIDDRISPLTNQGLICEVLRIRHRGLYDKLMSKGKSYQEKPTFYYIMEIDDLTYNSEIVEHLGTVEKIPFRTWDTITHEQKIIKDAAEEQETSKVKITVWERVKSGLFGRKTTDIERDSFQVTYNFRTGRWSGDDSFKDYDGYGHYLGKTFEVWFNLYQTDFDLDYIPYWVEVNILGTDPERDDSKKDPDNDRITTDWEWKWGYDPNSWDDHEKLDPDLDGLENIEEYNLARWFANPFSQDMYLEVDHMGAQGFFDPDHLLFEEAQQAIIEKYAQHNIKVYIDDGWPDSPYRGGGDVLPHYKLVSQDSGMMLEFYKNYFPDERKGAFRYVAMGHGGPFNHPAKGNVYDCVHITYAYSIKWFVKRWIGFGIAPTKRGTILTVASTLMHELGHSCGISPWNIEGCDNLTFYEGKEAKKRYEETWGNYVSIMNYYHMYKMDVLDYSDGSNGPPYDQNDWEQFFVGHFQYNAELIEEPFFETPGFDKIVYQETEFGVRGYIYNEELTEQFIKEIKDWSPVDPIEVEWQVYELEEKQDYPSDRTIKIYVKSNVPSGVWVLFSEASLDSDGEIQFYSMQDVIDDIMS